jgi:tetratricopeptide (TPR) repeat protein
LLVLVGIFWLITRRTLPAFFVICAGAVGTSALMIPLLNITWTPLGERYMYIPSAFFLIGVTLSVQQWKYRTDYKYVLMIPIVFLIVISLYGTVTRNILWQDNLALFQDALRKSPDFQPVQNEIAIALKQRGRLEESLEIFKKFEKKEGLINFQYGLVNKAGAFAANNEFDKARDILQDALQDPGKHEKLILEKMLEINKIQLLRGLTTASALYGETVKCLTRLFEITEDPFYQYRLGVVHLHEKNKKLALQSFITVTKIASPKAYYFKPAEKLARDLAK